MAKTQDTPYEKKAPPVQKKKIAGKVVAKAGQVVAKAGNGSAPNPFANAWNAFTNAWKQPVRKPADPYAVPPGLGRQPAPSEFVKRTVATPMYVPPGLSTTQRLAAAASLAGQPANYFGVGENTETKYNTPMGQGFKGGKGVYQMPAPRAAPVPFIPVDFATGASTGYGGYGGGGRRGGGGGGYGGYAPSTRVPSWLQNLYNWNFKG